MQQIVSYQRTQKKLPVYQKYKELKKNQRGPDIIIKVIVKSTTVYTKILSSREKSVVPSVLLRPLPNALLIGKGHVLSFSHERAVGLLSYA